MWAPVSALALLRSYCNAAYGLQHPTTTEVAANILYLVHSPLLAMRVVTLPHTTCQAVLWGWPRLSPLRAFNRLSDRCPLLPPTDAVTPCCPGSVLSCAGRGHSFLG